MKRIILASFLFSLFCMMIGCGKSGEIIKQENIEIEKHINENETILPRVTEEGSISPDTEITPNSNKKKLTKKEKYQEYANQVKIQFYDKKILPEDYDLDRYEDFVELDYKVMNNSPVAIKGIKGVLKIYDQFDVYIMSINWDISVGTIDAKTTKKITNYGFEYDEFDSKDEKVYNLAFEDMIFKYEMEQINFANGYKLRL